MKSVTRLFRNKNKKLVELILRAREWMASVMWELLFHQFELDKPVSHIVIVFHLNREENNVILN